MTTHDTKRLRRTWWTWIVFWAGLFIVTHVPIVGRAPFRPHHGDKIIHFVLYFLLAWLGGRYIEATSRRWPVGRLSFWAVIYLLYAALDECVQSFVGRSMSWQDWLADACGVVTATAWLVVRARVVKVSERPPGGRETGADDCA